jgi:N-acetylglucosaminyldiphosphoundecaprenol N-acetyl-beta-D-mannosaminyltransferase
MDEAVQAVLELVGTPGRHLVVTPNVDHLVLIERDADFASAYEQATLRLVDGAPLVVLARLVGTPVPGRVAGVDLTQRVLDAAASGGQSVYFLGGEPNTLDAAVRRIRAARPTLEIAGWAAPMIDLEVESAEEGAVLSDLRTTRPDVLFLFLGTPKQERWFWRRVDQLPDMVVALAVGGTVDVLAGVRRRAPRIVQRLGLEWVWRLVEDPRRLAHRYLVRDVAFLGIAARQLRDRYLRRRAPAAD